MAVTKLRGTHPRELAVPGMQQQALELGWELSEAVAAASELQCGEVYLVECSFKIEKENSYA